MLIQEALKETGKAQRFDNSVYYAMVDASCVLRWFEKKGNTSSAAIMFRLILDNDWKPYHEVKEIRPEKAGELWFNVNNGKYAHTSDYDDNGQTFWHEDCYVPRDISQIQDKVVHNQGWRRLSPPVEDDSVEKIVIDNVNWDLSDCWQKKPMLYSVDKNGNKFWGDIRSIVRNKPDMKMILEMPKEKP